MTEATPPPRTAPPGTVEPPSGVVDPDVVEAVMDPHTEGTPDLATDRSERRVLVIGEALVDAVHRADGSVQEHPGGSPANVALGLGRLGRGVDLLTWYGDDDRGRRLRDHLEASAVAILPGSETAPRTSVATATVDAAGSATYEFDLSWHVPDRWTSPPAPPLAVHTGSIAAVLEPGASDVAAVLAAHRPSATITYDPNVRPSLMPAAHRTRGVVEELVALADVVKVSDEDLAWLDPDHHPLDVCRRWVRTGPAVVVLTRGGDGATALTVSGHEVDVAAPEVTVADTVGAGDSFMSALIDGLWSADLLGAERRTALRDAPDTTWQSVLTRCADVAAVTVSRPGADPPRAAELDS